MLPSAQVLNATVTFLTLLYQNYKFVIEVKEKHILDVRKSF